MKTTRLQALQHTLSETRTRLASTFTPEAWQQLQASANTLQRKASDELWRLGLDRTGRPVVSRTN